MITRFAPSPTGPLHLGHAFSALTVWQVAARLGGTALLRIEDTDSTRVRPEFEAGIYTDLAWLGLAWPDPVIRQSERQGLYQRALTRLADQGLIYPCSCTRRQISKAGATLGADGLVYPGTCRSRPLATRKAGDALRLDLRKALSQINRPMQFEETGVQGTGVVKVAPDLLCLSIGDPVLLRKDTGDPSYHLACVHDDAAQAITHVVRGADLQALTPLHVLLQTVLGYPTPVYHHHGLVLDEQGKRLAKIDKSKALAKYRSEGATPADIRQMTGFAD